jgi:frataxin
MLSRAPRALLSLRPSLRFGRISPPAVHLQSRQFPRSFHPTPASRKGIQPDSSDPEPSKPQAPNVAGAAVHVTDPTPLTDEQYHEYSEHYLNVLLGELEQMQEDGSDVEAEYSV